MRSRQKKPARSRLGIEVVQHNADDLAPCRWGVSSPTTPRAAIGNCPYALPQFHSSRVPSLVLLPLGDLRLDLLDALRLQLIPALLGDALVALLVPFSTP